MMVYPDKPENEHGQEQKGEAPASGASGTEQAPRRIYVASSWRNPEQPVIVEMFRQLGHEVYDFRNPAPGSEGFAWSDIDPDWLGWNPRAYRRLLDHATAVEGFDLDFAAMEWADTFVLILPCGRSAHLEAGWAIGAGKPTALLLHEDKFEPELMYRMASLVACDVSEVCDWLDQLGTSSAAEPLSPDSDSCGCAYEDVDWNGQPVRRWFHEPGCSGGAPLSHPDGPRQAFCEAQGTCKWPECDCDCDCFIPTLEGAGQHSPGCRSIKRSSEAAASAARGTAAWPDCCNAYEVKLAAADATIRRLSVASGTGAEQHNVAVGHSDVIIDGKPSPEPAPTPGSAGVVQDRQDRAT